MSKLYNLKSVYSHVKTLYDIEPDTQEFEDLALVAWNLIGNKHTRLYRYIGDTKDRTLDLPCNFEHIESVHIPIEDAQMTSSKDIYYDIDSLFIEHYINAWKWHDDPFYHKGKLVKYKEGDDKLYFTRDYRKVVVIYHGIFADEDEGLPLINDKEMNAIAAYIAYVTLFKEGLRKRDKSTLELANVLKEDWLRKCNSARIVEHISQNEMNAILDVKSRWDRKTYSKSFKPIL